MQVAGELEPLIARLRLICGEQHVLADRAALAPYRSDAQRRERALPAAAVLPGSPIEVASVVRACAETAVPFVARGAGTGLAGGAVPIDDGILIVLSRMRGLVDVDLEQGLLVAEAGASARAIGRALAPSHWFPAAPSNDAATIGGIVATGGGGPRSLKYGPVRRHLAGLDVVLSDGSQVQLRDTEPGADLVGAFTGSEGTLGIATVVHLHARPAPPEVRVAVAQFDDPIGAAESAMAIIAAGVEPVALELMDGRALEISAQATKHAPGRPATADARLPTAGAALLIELDGSPEQCDAAEAALTEALAATAGDELLIVTDVAERERIWRAHTAALAGLGHAASGFSLHDPAVAPARLTEFLDRMRALVADAKLDFAMTARPAEGIVHPIVLYDVRVPGEATRARVLGDAILEACIDIGGTVSAEHGTGGIVHQAFGALFSDADLDAFARLRSAFDPSGLANPGRGAAWRP